MIISSSAIKSNALRQRSNSDRRVRRERGSSDLRNLAGKLDGNVAAAGNKRSGKMKKFPELCNMAAARGKTSRWKSFDGIITIVKLGSVDLRFPNRENVRFSSRVLRCFHRNNDRISRLNSDSRAYKSCDEVATRATLACSYENSL